MSTNLPLFCKKLKPISAQIPSFAQKKNKLRTTKKFWLEKRELVVTPTQYHGIIISFNIIKILIIKNLISPTQKN